MIAFLIKIWGLARPYRGRLLLGVLTGIIAGFMEPMLVAVVTFVYEVIFTPADSDFSRQAQRLPEFLRDWVTVVRDSLASSLKTHPGAVIALVAAIPAVLVLRGLFSYLNIYFLQWAAIRAVTDLRIRLFNHLMNLSAGFFNASRTGELMSRIISDTSALQSVISNATSVIVKDPAKLISLFAYLMWQEPKLTLISLIVMPLCIIPISVYGRKARRTAGKMQSQFAEISNLMAESFSGNRIIKTYNLENRVTENFRTAASALVGQYMRIVRAMETPGPLMEAFGAVGVALLFLYLAFKGGGPASSAAFLKVVASIFMMYQPLKNLARLHNTLEQAQAASERVFELLAMQSTIPEPASPKTLKADGADIEFANIDFSFGDKPVLQDVNLTVKAGQFIGLVGLTGSGKTTLTNLLLRLYDPQKGAIRIGGVDIREVTTRDLRNHIAVVTQETILFNDTIRHNIDLGRPGASSAEIEAAAKHAHADEFIIQRPEGYDTVVGEKGVTLSGGQRQRIAIARAILRNAPILILDEATNALDAKVERIVQDALEDLMKGRTTLCIAHRLSTTQKADLIVVLDQGRIVEKGTHDELMKLGGAYRRLWELQFQTQTSAT